MDLLSNIMSSVRIESTGIVIMDLTAPWGFHVEPNRAASLFTLTEGRCVISWAGGGPVEIEAGDVVLASPRTKGSTASDLSARRVGLDEIFRANDLPLWQPGSAPGTPLRLVHGGGGEPATALSLVFGFREALRESFMSVMPDMIILRKDECRVFPWIALTRDFLLHEAEQSAEGYVAVASRLAELLFVHIVRAHLLLHPDQTQGWLRGVSDRRVARALGAMHARMNEPWKVSTLAAEAGMSRSTFAATFADLVGQPPLEYLLNRRMEVAAERLAAGERSLTRLARDLGYSSQHAFAVAFTRVMGMPPGAYRRERAGTREDNLTG